MAEPKVWFQTFDTAETVPPAEPASLGGAATVVLFGEEAAVSRVADVLGLLFQTEELGTIEREPEIERELRLTPRGNA